MDNPEEAIQGPCALTLVVHPTEDDRVLMFRSVGDYATHWMDNRGVWNALPEADKFEPLMNMLTDNPEMLPLLAVEANEIMEEDTDV